MKKIIFFVQFLFLIILAKAQVNGAPEINLGPDMVIPCNTPCVNLSANLLDVGSTSNYTVQSIPHNPPLPYNAQLGNPVLTSGDDKWSDVIAIPFPFCFYGTTYNELKIGTNGALKLGPTPLTNGGNHPWSFNQSVPSPSLVSGGNIFGAYLDLAPSMFQGVIPGLLMGSINYFIIGNAPNRQFIVIYNNTPQYLCMNLNATTQIVLHESSNIIDVFIDNKPRCNIWNGGRAVVGIQNDTGTDGITPPGRNTGSYNISSPEAWRFLPSGPSSYSNIEWFDQGVSLGTGTTMNVCPTVSNDYVARTTFTTCTGQQIILEDTVNVQFDQVDVTVAPINSFICSGQSATISAISPQATGYSWSPGALTGNTVTVSPATTTSYVVTATNAANGCSATDTANVAIATPQTNVCNVLYVTPSGSSSAIGSKSDPLDLITAMNLGSCVGTVVKMAIGDYVINNTLVEVTSNLTLEGGFDPSNNWRKTSQVGATRILRTSANVTDEPGASPRIVAVQVTGQSGFRFQDITIEVQAAPTAQTGNNGISTYGLLLDGCSDYNIVRTQIIAGNAGSGGNGLAGADGADGDDGDDACGRNAGSGGGNGGDGGRGGSDTGCSPFGVGPCDGNSGQAGGNGGPAGGSGGNRGATCAAFGVFSGQHGGSGADGGNGANGTTGTSASAPTYGQYFVPGAVGVSGTAGTIGAGGSGAGGSGAATATDGGGGGGGGGGGAGGAGGEGGRSGGGSFAVYIYGNGSNGVFEDIDLFNGTFGTGGTGGTGGAGGVGGEGGTSSTNPCSGCQNFNNGGGNGGNGGNGGSGGNGVAGQSVLMYVNGSLPQVLNNGATETILAGQNSPTNFDLSAQNTIVMDDIACTETDVNFDGTSSATWDFGTGANPTSATGQTVLTEYLTLGRRDVDFNSSAYTGFTNIILDAQLLPEFITSAPLVNGVYRVCSGTEVTFSATNSGVNYIFNWDLGGGASPNTYNGISYQTISATFNTPGEYVIELSYETNCCGLSLPGSITLRVDETPVITASSDQQFCLGTYGGVELAVSGVTVGGAVVWSPTNGLSSFNQDTVYALPNSTTTYTATVTDSSGYCSVQEDITVEVTDLILTPTTTNATCAVLGTATVSVSGGSGSYSYQWSNNETTSSISNLQPGTYTVVVTDNNLGCMDSIDAIVQAGANTLTAEAIINNELCADANDGQIIVNAIAGTAPYNFEWVELGTTNSSSQSDTMSNLSPGVYNINVTDANGCLFEVNANIAEADSFVVIQDTVHATTCLGLFDGYVRLRIDGGQTPYTFTWSNGVAVDIQDGDVVAQDLGPGIYTLYISDSRVCTDSFIVDFTVDSVPTYITDTLVCYGTTVDVFGTNVIIENDTSFQDTIYEASGCATEINILNIQMLDLPSATLTADPDTIFEQQTSVLTATSGFNYDWNPESSSNTNSITVSPTETTEYSLVVSDENGCENTYSVTVYISERELELKIPDAFSPNGDGTNDIFRVANPEYFDNIELKVYNRWGELVHKAKGTNHGWDGTYRNTTQPVDVYTYTLKAVSKFSGKKINLSGNVTLFR